MDVETWLDKIATLQKERTQKRSLKLPTPAISLFHEYLIINERKQFSKNKIQNTKMIQKQLYVRN